MSHGQPAAYSLVECPLDVFRVKDLFFVIQSSSAECGLRSGEMSPLITQTLAYIHLRCLF